MGYQVKYRSSGGCCSNSNKKHFGLLFQSVKPGKTTTTTTKTLEISPLHLCVCVLEVEKHLFLFSVKVFGWKPVTKVEQKTVIQALDYSLQLHIIETDGYVSFKMCIDDNDSEINSLAYDKLLQQTKNKNKTFVSL